MERARSSTGQGGKCFFSLHGKKSVKVCQRGIGVHLGVRGGVFMFVFVEILQTINMIKVLINHYLLGYPSAEE